MNDEYTDARALELQADAFNGDEAACWWLIQQAKPPLLSMLGESGVPKTDWDCCWSNCVDRLAIRIAGNNRIEKWQAYAWMVCKSVVVDRIRANSKRQRAEEEHLSRIHVRYTEAYPALHDSIDELALDDQDLIRRMYFRAQRQDVMSMSVEYCMNYYRMMRWHFRVLAKLRKMMLDKGFNHA